MKRTTSAEALYRAKAERRKELVGLTIDEKVKMIEKLHQFGRSMRSLKAQFNRR